MPRHSPSSVALPQARRRAWPHRLVVTVLLLVGVVVTGWPVVETLDNNRRGAELTTEYVTSIESSSPRALSEELRAAGAYNAHLPTEALNDPWGDDSGEADAEHARYLGTLSLATAIARLRIPRIDVDLPVFHDAGAASLAAGVGHMYGSSLPVGGPGTHAVLAGHTDYRGRTLFDRLPELRLGHSFEIAVAGEVLTYRIDQIVIVEPWELEDVQRIPGGDYVTLVTCYTPPGEHTQRMLVRGIRAPSDAAVSGAGVAVGYDAGVQDWMWARIAGVVAALGILTAMIVAWIAGDRRRARRPAADSAADNDPTRSSTLTGARAPTRTITS
ncbi:class C sortase [Propionicicella superfundia]|uniref:class C sortase n=1 Tax=Propionicicella superfundia TaxID=348582 RepID=UPI00040070C5|nr:class C sortase [Propionicicella superfundia]